MKNKFTDKVSKESKLLETAQAFDYRDDDAEDEIIDLVDLVEENDSAQDDVASSEERAAKPLDDHSLGEEKAVKLDGTREAKGKLDDMMAGENAESDPGDATSKEMREDTGELDVYTVLSDFFDSCELETSKLVEGAIETGEELEEHPAGDNGYSKKHFSDLKSKAEAAGADGTVRDIPEAADQLPENLFVDLEDLIKVGGDDYSAEETPDPEDELPEDLFVDLEVADKTTSVEDYDTEAPSLEVETTSIPNEIDWIDTDQYSPVALDTIDRKIAEHQQKIEKLIAEKAERKKEYEYLKGILYLTGDELKKAVVGILTKYWSVKIAVLDKGKRTIFNENILIEYDRRRILAKIKGTYNSYPPYKFITQVWRDLHYSRLGASAEGALILNYDIGKNPRDRNLAYVNEDEEQLDDLIFIDTRILQSLTIAIIDYGLPVEEAKEILFKKGRVEFDIDDLTV